MRACHVYRRLADPVGFAFSVLEFVFDAVLKALLLVVFEVGVSSGPLLPIMIGASSFGLCIFNSRGLGSEFARNDALVGVPSTGAPYSFAASSVVKLVVILSNRPLAISVFLGVPLFDGAMSTKTMGSVLNVFGFGRLGMRK